MIFPLGPITFLSTLLIFPKGCQISGAQSYLTILPGLTGIPRYQIVNLSSLHQEYYKREKIWISVAQDLNFCCPRLWIFTILQSNIKSISMWWPGRCHHYRRSDVINILKIDQYIRWQSCNSSNQPTPSALLIILLSPSKTKLVTYKCKLL